jgi:hypothetical protein
MSWNYRVIRHKDKSLAIHEVFYHDDGTAHSVTTEPTEVVSDTGMKGLKADLDSMALALSREVIDMEYFMRRLAKPKSRLKKPRRRQSGRM